jgi:hypothetical protein
MSTPPLTVRLYGLFPITRRRYVFQLVVAVGLMAALLVSWGLVWPGFRDQLQELPITPPAWIVPFGNAIPWILLVALGLQVLEAWIVLRLFARKQHASSPAVSEPAP